jgi:zinc D-Ala-D-Ala carboxypeptidase
MNKTLTQIWASLDINEAILDSRGLGIYEEAELSSLVLVRVAEDGREYRLSADAARAWHRMQDAAKEDGIDLIVLSAFRSIARQTEIIESKLAAGMVIDEVLRSIAPPGCSEHHTGRAVDIGSADHPTLDEDFASTQAYVWLCEHAHTFGFTMSYPQGNVSGYVYEPWHWCWHPTVNV